MGTPSTSLAPLSLSASLQLDWSNAPRLPRGRPAKTMLPTVGEGAQSEFDAVVGWIIAHDG